MQVTDVRKPLISVSKICGSGHEVVLSRIGGKIIHFESGQITKFDRVDDVYRLHVRLPGPKAYNEVCSVFTRPVK